MTLSFDGYTHTPILSLRGKHGCLTCMISREEEGEKGRSELPSTALQTEFRHQGVPCRSLALGHRSNAAEEQEGRMHGRILELGMEEGDVLSLLS